MVCSAADETIRYQPSLPLAPSNKSLNYPPSVWNRANTRFKELIKVFDIVQPPGSGFWV